MTTSLSFSVGRCGIPIRWRSFDCPHPAHQYLPRIKRQGCEFVNGRELASLATPLKSLTLQPCSPEGDASK